MIPKLHTIRGNLENNKEFFGSGEVGRVGRSGRELSCCQEQNQNRNA